MTRLAFRLLAASALAVGLGAAAHAQDADWAKVTAAAKQEGNLTLYTAINGNKVQLGLFRQFEADTGIKVDVLDVRVSELEQRLQAEQSAARYVADIYMTNADSIDTMAKAGLIGPLGKVPNMARLRPEATPTEARVPVYLVPAGIMINTNLVKPEDEPKSWKDLLDPKWKGKIISDDYRAQGGGFIFFSATLEKLGRPFHEALAGQGMTFSREIVNDQFRVARGEFPIKIPQNLPMYMTSVFGKGLPVKLIIPAEGATYTTINLSIPRNAPHANAARLFIDYFLSNGFQVALGNDGEIPVVTGIESQLKPEMAAFARQKLLGTTKLENRDTDMAAAKDIYR